jgi:hypothetical protein
MRCTAPDLADPVVGFRQWRLTDGRLRSLYSGVRWQGRELRARCALDGRHFHESPANACSCGIYAYYDPCPRTASAGTRELIAGAVVLWGRLELHARGMRAQYARVVALELPFSRGRKRSELERVAQRLDVPVVPHRKLAAVASLYGLPLESRMRPPRCWESSGLGHRRGLPGAIAALAGGSRLRSRVGTKGGGSG